MWDLHSDRQLNSWGHRHPALISDWLNVAGCSSQDHLYLLITVRVENSNLEAF